MADLEKGEGKREKKLKPQQKPEINPSESEIKKLRRYAVDIEKSLEDISNEFPNAEKNCKLAREQDAEGRTVGVNGYYKLIL